MAMSTGNLHEKEITKGHSSFAVSEHHRRDSAADEPKATSLIQNLFRKKAKKVEHRSPTSSTSSFGSFGNASASTYQEMLTLCVPFAALAERRDEFPQQVIVRSSLPPNQTGCEYLYENRVLNLHFVKETDYLLMTGEDDEYRVPLNSSLRFSPLHFSSEPGSTTETIERALEGYHFNRVSEILAKPKLPMVVAVTEKTNECPFDAWEILVIKKAKQRRQDRQRYLVSYSFLTGKETCLYDGSELKCCTKPELFQLYISQMVKHLQLPLQVVINKDEQSHMHSLLDGKVFTLHPGGTVKSVIATCADDPHIVLDIQADTKVDVSLLHPNFETAKKLLKTSLELYEDFSSVSLSEYIFGDEYQEDLFSQVFDPLVGVKIYKPQNTNFGVGYDHVQTESGSCSEADLVTHGTTSESDEVEASDYDDVIVYKSANVFPFLDDPEKHRILLKTMCDNIGKLQCSIEEMKSGFSSLQEETKNLSGRLAVMEAKLQTLQETVNNDMPKNQLTNSASDLHPDVSVTNTELLLGLGRSQVMKLLDEIDMGMYKEVFDKEQIDGRLFMDLDEDILEHDLGMTSYLHRQKLIKLKQGKLKVDWSFLH